MRSILFSILALLLVAAPAAADCGACGSGGAAHAGHDHADHHHAMAPSFELTDHAGNVHKLSDYAGKIVVLEWTNPGCPFVQRHYSEGSTTMIDMAAKFGAKDVVWLAIDSTKSVTAASAAAWAEKKGIEYPILLDADGSVGQAYGAKTTPHMYVIGPKGEILYQGAIDDDPAGKGGEVTNYVKMALKSALAGEPVETASTKPYGCSVKYADNSEKKAAASR